MKSPLRSGLPQFDSSARLPLLLAVVLTAALLLQLGLVDDVTLPDAGVVPAGRRTTANPPAMESAVPIAAIVARSIFAPRASQAASGSAGSADPLAGIAIAGSMRIGPTLYAVVQRPGARPGYVRPGGRIAGWRLDAITPNDVRLRRGSERLTVPFGGGSTAMAGGVSGESE